jgi:hypothetical protein
MSVKYKIILLWLMAIVFLVSGCQSLISQLLPVGITSADDTQPAPTLVATAAQPIVVPDPLTATSTPPAESQEPPEKPFEERMIDQVSPTATQTIIVPTNTPLPSPTPSPTPELTGPFYYVSPEGNDWGGNGSMEQPWATIGQALQRVEDGATILVRPGIYFGQVALERRFSQGVTVQSEQAYQAQLRHDDTVVICYFCQGITLSGFNIAHTGAGAGRYVIQIQDLNGDGSGGRQVMLRNNIIHDSRNNDLLKINNGADTITVEGNLFYNMGGPDLDSLIDVNSATGVIIQDNVLFNDFQASDRSRDNDTGSFIVVKDSNGNEDSNLGSKDVVVRRNVFLNWQGDPNNAFLVIGEDDVDYFQAEDVLIENNLMLGNTRNPMRAALHIRGSRDIVFRHNTVTGDLPSRSYAIRLSRADNNPANENIHFYNNIWSDPMGSMGVFQESNGDLFAEAWPADSRKIVLLNNLYWNGGELIPWDEEQLINYTDDPQRILADPQLPVPEDVMTPVWLVEEGHFAGGFSTIREVFEWLVFSYGQPTTESRVINAGEPAESSVDDILGRPRFDGAPDVGAYESNPS